MGGQPKRRATVKAILDYLEARFKAAERKSKDDGWVEVGGLQHHLILQTPVDGVDLMIGSVGLNRLLKALRERGLLEGEDGPWKRGVYSVHGAFSRVRWVDPEAVVEDVLEGSSDGEDDSAY